MPRKPQPATSAQGAYHVKVCAPCGGLGRHVKVIGKGRLEQVTCRACDGKGGR